MVNRNIPLSVNAPLSERLKYAPDTVDLEMVADVIARYEALLAVVNDSDLDLMIGVDDDPAVVKADIDKALESVKRSAVEQSDYYDFFDDCVGALSGYWPGASIGDDHLKQVILDAIASGDA